MKNNIPTLITTFLILTACGTAQADEPLNAEAPTYKAAAFPLAFSQPWYEKIRYPHLYAISIGPIFSSSVGESQYFAIQNPNTDSFYNYQKSNEEQTGGQFALFIGDRWDLAFPWKVEAGISYHQTSSWSSKGSLTQGADVLSQDQYNYKFQVRSKQLEAKGKLSYDYPGPIFPYISLGLGAAFNTADNFSTNAPVFLATTRSFASHTKTSFTYTLGLGTEYALNSHFNIGLGYEFSNNGAVSFGNATVASLPVAGTLSQSHLYSHSVMGTVSYLLDNQYHASLKQLADWD